MLGFIVGRGRYGVFLFRGSLVRKRKNLSPSGGEAEELR